MNAAQRHRQAALLKATGYQDGPALTPQSTAGDIPHGRELSFAWLAGTVMTGLTSVLLMGAALYMAFQGQDTFSTAYDALQIEHRATPGTPAPRVKTNRIRPVAQTRSEREIVEASVRETIEGIDRIHKKAFVRVSATLATSGTALSGNIPAYDPVALLARSQTADVRSAEESVSTEIYGAEVEGEVTISAAALMLNPPPVQFISDRGAAKFVRTAVEGAYTEYEGAVLAYAALPGTVREIASPSERVLAGIAQNVTSMAMNQTGEDAAIGRTERIITLRQAATLNDTLKKNGFTPAMTAMVARALRNVLPATRLAAGWRLRILFGPDRATDSQIPYRMSIYAKDRHAATVALTDSGQYVLGLAPPAIEFPDADTEQINVAQLPSIYRSIWETGRKHDLEDAVIERIIAMYAYDIDLKKRISAGDSIDLLQTSPDAEGRQELLYVALTLSGKKREFFRFRTNDGAIAFYDADGQTGKRFLTRRPLKGGGRLRSRFGWRIHPIFKVRKLHTGVDLAAPTGTPIYAAGNGVIKRAQWVSGYGRMVEITHVNGYQTGYAHMTRIASGMKPGARVRQGQIIGYVGSTGYSTGPHLHYEIRINNRPVDPLSVKLPKDKTLASHYAGDFTRTVDHIHDLMARDPAPITVASAQ